MKYARCENMGENEDFKRACRQEGVDVQFECTMLGTPQQNGRVEEKFAFLRNSS